MYRWFLILKENSYFEKKSKMKLQIKNNLLKIFLLITLFSCSGLDGKEDSTELSEEIIGDAFKVSAEFAELFYKIERVSTVGNNQSYE